eukprot:14971820-Alexandrium_andersonii.AAC.1
MPSTLTGVSGVSSDSEVVVFRPPASPPSAKRADSRARPRARGPAGRRSAGGGRRDDYDDDDVSSDARNLRDAREDRD